MKNENKVLSNEELNSLTNQSKNAKLNNPLSDTETDFLKNQNKEIKYEVEKVEYEYEPILLNILKGILKNKNINLDNCKLLSLNEKNMMKKGTNLSFDKFMSICKRLDVNITLIARDEDEAPQPMGYDITWKSNL
jgi:hypothetical protein